MSDSVWPHSWQPTRLPRPGILQARTLEWVAISFSNAWKSKVKVKSLSHVWLLATPQTAAYQAPLSMGFSRQEYQGRVPFPTFFNLSLILAIRCSWSEPQSAPSLLFADCIELLHLWLQRIQSDFGVDHLLMSMCRVSRNQRTTID